MGPAGSVDIAAGGRHDDCAGTGGCLTVLDIGRRATHQPGIEQARDDRDRGREQQRQGCRHDDLPAAAAGEPQHEAGQREPQRRHRPQHEDVEKRPHGRNYTIRVGVSKPERSGRRTRVTVPAGTPRRILVVLPHLAVGGAERHLLQVLPRLDRGRFAVSVCATHGPDRFDAPMRAAGIPVLAPPRERHGAASVPGKALHFLRSARAVRPDLVHFFLPQAYLIGAPLAVLLGIRPRVMSRRSLNDYQRRRPIAGQLERCLHRCIDAFAANSSAVAANLVAEGVDPRRLRIIANGIDSAPFAGLDRARARDALGLAADELAIVCIANLIPYKGHADLLDALAAAALPPRWR
ncbi:MAG: glycosyltransferase, partial [Alphaproteobacteria bacterium]|nr:glycosyltransferase [Alphaproteobacteria bacterium]